MHPESVRNGTSRLPKGKKKAACLKMNSIIYNFDSKLEILEHLWGYLKDATNVSYCKLQCGRRLNVPWNFRMSLILCAEVN